MRVQPAVIIASSKSVSGISETISVFCVKGIYFHSRHLCVIGGIRVCGASKTISALRESICIQDIRVLLGISDRRESCCALKQCIKMPMYAKIQYLQTKNIENIPVSDIEQFQKSPPKNTEDYNPKRVYHILYNDEANKDPVSCPILIGRLGGKHYFLSYLSA